MPKSALCSGLDVVSPAMRDCHPTIIGMTAKSWVGKRAAPGNALRKSCFHSAKAAVVSALTNEMMYHLVRRKRTSCESHWVRTDVCASPLSDDDDRDATRSEKSTRLSCGREWAPACRQAWFLARTAARAYKRRI